MESHSTIYEQWIGLRKRGSLMEGKVAIITGGGSGIGRATALAFAQRGVSTVIADILVEEGEQTVQMIRATGGKAVFSKTDVSQPGEVEAMVNQAVDTFGRLDYAFNNAGIEGVQAPTAEFPLEKWRQVIDVNLTGVWLCMRYQIPHMLKQGQGVIINNASILGKVGFANASAYVASKHALLGLTKTAAIEYATQNIRVNAICPAFIETPMLERGGLTTNPEIMKMIVGLHPMKRLGTVEEIASAVIWLCSDEASFVTGHSMLIDGGYVAQ
jgi:NAD(P)-dependent dehydrogenase (short-subunit alcohol dehydrogenase family)